MKEQAERSSLTSSRAKKKPRSGFPAGAFLRDPVDITFAGLSSPTDEASGGCGSRVAHALVDMGGERFEIIHEQLHQLVRGAVVFVFVVPGRAWVEDLAVDARYTHWDFETEVRILAEFRVVERPVERGVE